MPSPSALRLFLAQLLKVAIGVGILLGLNGCWLLPERALQQVFKITSDQNPTSTLFISHQAPAVLTLQINPDRLEPPAFLATLLGKPQIHQGLAELKKGVLDSLNLKYDVDLRPWLGSEISLALTSLDFDRNPNNGLRPGYLLALAVRDPIGVREFLQRFWQTRAVGGQPLTYERFKGATLIYDRPLENRSSENSFSGQSSPSTPIASALVGQYFLLFANDPQVLREALTIAQVPDLSLAFNDAYNRALQELPDPRLGLGTLNLSTLWAGLQQQPLTRKVAHRVTVPTQAELLLSLSPTRYGLNAKIALATQREGTAPLFATLPSAALPILNLLPPDTLLMATGQELAQLWAEGEGLAQQVSWVEAALQPFKTRLSATNDQGISLLQLFLQGFQGSYVVGLVPEQLEENDRLDDAQRDWIIAIDRSAFGAVETLGALDQLANDRGYEVSELPFREHTVTTWTRLEATENSTNRNQVTVKARLGGLHTQIDRYEVFTPSLNTLGAVLAAWDGESLLDTDSFQTLIAPLATGGYNYLYLNWPQSREWLEQRLPSLKLVEFAGYALFHALDTIVLSSNPPVDNGTGGTVESATIALGFTSH
ncbi:MAG: DUF3352 domain-containing protein [Prochlorotrichaceae cyanobacterium]